MAVFLDSNGSAVKFFIQKDLSPEVQTELNRTITDLGGRVEIKVPRQGYILVQPGTAEEERLRLCWTSLDRPDRHFVAYTYVEACRVAGARLRQIFTEDGHAIKIHIHHSIADPTTMGTLTQQIMNYGGDPQASAEFATVILGDPQSELFQTLVKTHSSAQDKHIESYLWVNKCIEQGYITYTPMVYRNPGGRRAGEERTPFTDADEQHLCKWISVKIPYKSSGGRTGNRLYQQLCELSDDPEFAWVRRHTWQSWRERYKKNADRLDRVINAIVQETKPEPGENGQIGYVRQTQKPAKRPGRKTSKRATESIEFLEPTATHDNTVMVKPEPHLEVMYSAGPAMTGSSSPAEEEMDEESQWPVRVGDESPPVWGKRKASQVLAEGSNSKRKRFSSPDEQLRHARTLDAQTIQAVGHVHVVDQAIQEIAREFRFTVEEVQEFYDKCGEMGRTRARFQLMRKELLKFGD